MNPRQYEKKSAPSVPLLPDIHPLLDKLYRPYDIGQVGQLDLNILTGIFGGDHAAAKFTPQWNGGVYWAGQSLAATPAEQSTTKSLALFYLSTWKDEDSATAFAQLYATELGRKYSNLKPDTAAQKSGSGNLPAGEQEQVFSTSEGPVLITTRGKLVFVAESFPLDVGRKLTELILTAQGSGELRMALATPNPAANAAAIEAAPRPISADLVRLFASAGVMKSAVAASRLASEPPRTAARDR
jgi:hypothetical protein